MNDPSYYTRAYNTNVDICDVFQRRQMNDAVNGKREYMIKLLDLSNALI